MTHRDWVRLDNASNIFLAARSAADPKVFRLSAEVDHDVDPELLQQALDETYDRYRLYHAVLQSGLFWYYLQDSDLHPLVTADEQHTCAPIYQAGRRNLLFRVVHHRRRISLEVFHALSDGTGAAWFLSDLVNAYIRLRHPDSDRSPQLEDSTGAHEAPAEPVHGLSIDSFADYFHQRHQSPASGSVFSRAARSATSSFVNSSPSPADRWKISRLRRPADKKVHRVGGTRTPDNRTRAVELTMPTDAVLGLARAADVSLTMYLTALFFESIRISSGGLGRARTLAASVPVNLRQFFPSESARNFFATVRVEHTYGRGEDDLGSICKQLESQFLPQATHEALEKKLRWFIRVERMPGLRIMPRPLKDVILGMANRHSNRGLSVAVSNLGRMSLPEPADSHVGRVLFHVSAVRPQFCATSHAGLLAVSFTSPFVETDHIREFTRMLTAEGVDVTVAAERVTEQEIAEGRS
ncbi:alcohol acetyltransferase [Brevibacterium sp. RIT 803]|uniref:alcohol acetyltransferase n=1 Tax=Brevibacterium sp. RIT 803 TaxID=2810210 RepID=UPI00194F4D37|nr:alcohol acetyltransferase [Brevibacterium sp. RIT 803]MBM6589124.1 alcohol acetyltransferase [Brevibacterium sp. RIT 803]